MKKLFPLLASLVGALFILYAGLWFWMGGKVEAEAGRIYAQGLRDHIILYGSPPKVTGFPGKHTVRFAGQIRLDEREFSIPELVVQGFFLPGQTIKIALPRGLSQSFPVGPDMVVWTLDSAYAEIVVPERLPASGFEPDIRVWQQDGGLLEIRRLVLDRDALKLEGTGNLMLDEDLQPSGMLDFKVIGHMEFLNTLKEMDLIEERPHTITAAVMGALTKDGVMSAQTSLRSRILWVGPVKAASLPAIEWPLPLPGPDTHNPPAPPQ